MGRDMPWTKNIKYKEFERAVRVEEIDGLRLVKRLAENMEEMFHKKAQRLVEAAEEAHLQHREDPNLQYEYFNAVLINEVDEEGNSVELGGEFILQPNDHFNNLSVNLSLSVVQVPTNMYNKDSAIVNGVYWSEALNKVFVDNFERDPSLIWQYFGSAKGFFRQYPGIKWKPDEHGVIAFDCRNRKWYIQAATSPKDVVILVDVSGSMKGLRLTIARQTVSSILDTLGDDDFFNIIAYNEELHYVEPCLNGTLVQADITNKDVSLSFLFNETGRGSECSQAIMLVTDGAVDTYDAIFAKYNWPERKVRIFPYLIGRESAFADNLKWMACANKGYFTQISTLADVQENVMEYLHVLSRPKVIDLEHDTVWTEAYIDSTRNRGILLGVVGTDVPVSELLKTIPKYKLGIHGYAFAITNNGYILTHPDLRPLYGDGKKRRKPNYSSVDLSEVEWEDKDDTLRNAMVNRKTGTFSMEVKKSVDKGVRNPKFKNAQTHTNKSFSDGPQRCARENTQLGESTLPRGLHDLEHPDVALADEWTYCNTDEHPEHRYLSQIEAIKLYLSGHEPHLKCDKELVQEVLFDAVVTAPLEAYWTSLVLNKSENSDKGVEIAYLGTRTGLSRINLFVVPDELTNQDFLTAEDKEGVFNADHFPLWYKRAAEQVPGTFVYSLPFNIGYDCIVLLSAVGIQMKLEFFQKKFWTASRQVHTKRNHFEKQHVYYLFRGQIILEGRRMRKTRGWNELETYVCVLYMCVCWCEPFYDFLCLLTTGGEILHPLDMNPVEVSLVHLPTARGECEHHNTDPVTHMEIYITPMHLDYLPILLSTISCLLSLLPSSSFFFSFLFLAVCAVIGRSFVIQQIPSSNLFMVVVDNKCDCSMFEPITMDPIEIMYILHWPKNSEVASWRGYPGWIKEIQTREINMTGA
uniref:VWFA domain-containing protein n=1 Tax=Amphiprion ocellaris TaxID=80972 RepID=A0AAQ5YC36_AMPOC